MSNHTASSGDADAVGADESAGSGVGAGEPTVVREARPPWARKDPAAADEVRHSPLVGYMSVPVGRRFPIRRSTLLLVVAFLGLGTVLYFNPPNADASRAGGGTVVHTANGDFYLPGAVKVPPSTTTTTTVPTTTTTTRPPTTTTTGPAGSTTTSSTSTTSTVPAGGGSGGVGSTTTTTTTTTTGSSGGGVGGGGGTTTTTTSP